MDASFRFGETLARGLETGRATAGDIATDEKRSARVWSRVELDKLVRWLLKKQDDQL